MNNPRLDGVIHVNEVNLWAHVGVLEEDRLYGRKFLLDFHVGLDLCRVVKSDNLLETVDYSIVITSLQKLALQINCQTIECFSEQILDCLESFYGIEPIHIFLRKCSPPVPGFTGIVGIERSRNNLTEI